MDALLVTLLTSIVTGASALLGVMLNSSLQLRTQQTNQQFQAALEAEKRKSETQERQKALALERLAKAHKLLSTIGREFSLTNFDILWRGDMKDSEYDQRYLSFCAEVDELRVIAGLFETTVSDEVEHLYGQMNIFWGNFMNVLRLTRLGKKVDHTTPCLQIAHKTANDIGNLVTEIKSRLTRLAIRYRKDN